MRKIRYWTLFLCQHGNRNYKKGYLISIMIILNGEISEFKSKDPSVIIGLGGG